MGDFERLLRNRDQRYRVPALSDEENSEITRVYFGNPFKILQSLQRHQKADPKAVQAELLSEGAFDERAFEHAGGYETPALIEQAPKKKVLP